MEIWVAVASGIFALLGGGGVVVSWMLFRKQSKRIKNAEADSAETKADAYEFEYLKERLIFAEQQSLEKEKSFADQTLLVRKLNADIVELWQRLLDEQKAKAAVELELQTKRCDRKKCGDRQPPNEY